MLVGTATVTAQGRLQVDAQRGGGDFYMATSGDLHLATSEDFYMATDRRIRRTPVSGFLACDHVA